MELKVWVEGIQRIVCGVTVNTTCQVISFINFLKYLNEANKIKCSNKNLKVGDGLYFPYSKEQLSLLTTISVCFGTMM